MNKSKNSWIGENNPTVHSKNGLTYQPISDKEIA